MKFLTFYLVNLQILNFFNSITNPSAQKMTKEFFQPAEKSWKFQNRHQNLHFLTLTFTACIYTLLCEIIAASLTKTLGTYLKQIKRPSRFSVYQCEQSSPVTDSPTDSTSNIRYQRLHRCWWRMLETKCVGDKFEMLVTDLIHWKKHQHNDSATNISNQSSS